MRPPGPRPGALQDEGDLAVERREVAVPAGHRQPVVLADGRDRDDLDAQVEVAHHAPHEQQLLGVLLAEERQVRARQAQQLGDDGQDAVEVARAARALEHLAERARGHADPGGAVGVDDVGPGANTTSAPFPAASARSSSSVRG